MVSPITCFPFSKLPFSRDIWNFSLVLYISLILHNISIIYILSLCIYFTLFCYTSISVDISRRLKFSIKSTIVEIELIEEYELMLYHKIRLNSEALIICDTAIYTWLQFTLVICVFITISLVLIKSPKTLQNFPYYLIYVRKQSIIKIKCGLALKPTTQSQIYDK